MDPEALAKYIQERLKDDIWPDEIEGPYGLLGILGDDYSEIAIEIGSYDSMADAYSVLVQIRLTEPARVEFGDSYIEEGFFSGTAYELTEKDLEEIKQHISKS